MNMKRWHGMVHRWLNLFRGCDGNVAQSVCEQNYLFDLNTVRCFG